MKGEWRTTRKLLMGEGATSSRLPASLLIAHDITQQHYSQSRDVIGHVAIGFATSYRCSNVTETLSPTIFEILSPEYIVMTLTFQGKMTSLVK